MNSGKLPLLLSVPHAGLTIPREVADKCILDEEQIIADGDVGAADIYIPLRDEAEQFLTTNIARAAVDLNRSTDDRRKDGVVKTHTCWDVKIWSEPLTEVEIDSLLEKYYHPYHNKLSELTNSGIIAGIDCHTMASKGPPVGPDSGQRRPEACISNAEGTTCPDEWLQILSEKLAAELMGEVRINDPFKGGYITRTHSREMPWIQLELSRAPFMSNAAKSRAVLNALERWTDEIAQ